MTQQIIEILKKLNNIKHLLPSFMGYQAKHSRFDVIPMDATSKPTKTKPFLRVGENVVLTTINFV